MAVGDPPSLLRVHLTTRYRADLRFWHCHEYRVDPPSGALQWPADSFNPQSKVRFSAKDSTPPRAMWYGAQFPTAAVWETLLRQVIGDEQGGVVLPRKNFAGWRLTAMRNLREFQMLPLFSTSLRALATTPDARQTWLSWTQIPDHPPTHAPANGLLAEADAAGVPLDGLVWHSHQAGSYLRHPVVGVLYAPRASSADLVIDPAMEAVDLDDPVRGDALIAAALHEAGLWRYPDDLDAIADEPSTPVEPVDPP